MAKKTEEQEVVESTATEEFEVVDLKEAFDHAAAAIREAVWAAAEATKEVLAQGGKLAEQTVDEAQRTVVYTLDDEMLGVLNKMVSADLFETRADAIRHLLRQGIKSSGDLLAQIDKVEEEIEALRTKMREIPVEGADD